MNFLFDYYKYIKNVDSLDTSTDLKVYNMFKKHTKNDSLVIVEGLITTHPIKKSVDIIKRRFPKLSVKVEDEGEIYIEGEMKKLKNYIPLFTNLGYFVSLYTINGQDWIKEYSDNIKPIALYLEPKYDLKIDVIPEKLYHSSPIKFKDKISKIGFIPKTGNKLSNHPDRIYLTDSLDTAINFGYNIIKSGFCVYEINGSNIKNLYSDINLRNSGYYTQENISPNNFNLIKEIEN